MIWTRYVRYVVALLAGLGGALALTAGSHASAEICLPPLIPCTTTTTPSHPITTPKPPVLATPGARYDGHRGTKSYAELSVATDSKRLSEFAFGFRHGSCSDGKPFASGGGAKIPTGAAIGSTGYTFYSRVFPKAWEPNKAGKRVYGRERLTFSATFYGWVVAGTLRDSFDSSKLRCTSGPISFLAYPDGTPEAPLRTSTVTSATYQGGSVSGADPFTAKVFVPWQLVTRVELHFKATCTNSASVTAHLSLGSTPLRGSRFRFTGGGYSSFGHGYFGRTRYALGGRFFLSGAYRVELKWRYAATVYSRGKAIDKCSTAATWHGEAG